jgi:hypothetical protein
MEEFLSIGQNQRLARRGQPFTMKNGVLYKMGQNNRSRRCLPTTKVQKVMKELHDGTTKRDFRIEITQKKILDAGY